MPIPYRFLSEDTLNLLAESGDTQALMELGYRAERLALLAEAQELAKRLRENCGRCPLDQQQRCKSCGRPDKFNFHVPDEIWNAVVPDELSNLVVCLDCFDEFAAAKGVRYAAHLNEVYFVGRRATLRLAVSWSLD